MRPAERLRSMQCAAKLQQQQQMRCSGKLQQKSAQGRSSEIRENPPSNENVLIFSRPKHMYAGKVMFAIFVDQLKHDLPLRF
jgi:hypothetical protein